MGKTRFVHALVTGCLLISSTTVLAAERAKLPPPWRCGRALVNSYNRVLAVDRRSLARCVLSASEAASPGGAETRCAVLRTRGSGPDRADRRARHRIEHRCNGGFPDWAPAACPGPGPQKSVGIVDSASLATCTISSAHCEALESLNALVTDAVERLAWQNPDNLKSDLGDIAGNSFDRCLAGEPTTTTTTLAPATTTTIDSATTTTIPASTTTLPAATTTTVPAGGPAQLVITEFMANPAAQSDSAGEYFELYNAGTAAVDLGGLTVSDNGSNSFTIAGPLLLDAGAYAVLARSASAAAGRVDYVYGSAMSLANSSDQIIVSDGTALIDSISYDAQTFPILAGQATVLAANLETTASNDDGANWCASSQTMSDGDFGSPGAAASDCLR